MSGKRGPRLSSFTPIKRVVAHQVDVVVDHHDVAQRVERIDAAAGVGNHQQLGPQGPHHADGKGDLPLRVALVGVKSALHGHHRHALQQAADELARVADRRGPREVRDGGVVERRLGLDLAGHAAQAGAQHDPRIGLLAPMGVNDVGGLGDLGG